MARKSCGRIVIADDHTLFAEACQHLLEPEFEVVGVVTDGRALLEACEQHCPNVAIVDVSMPLLNGLDAAQLIRRKNSRIKFIFLTVSVSADVAAEAFRRGASAYLVKHCTAEELVTAVRRVLRGESYLSPMITNDTVQFLLRTGREYHEEKRISSRQAEVLQLLAEGKSMKEVAYLLDVRPGTVAFHKYKIMETLEIKTTAQLIEYAFKHHLIG